MSALTCDICGGNLAMNESGDFAVCESCGMKHTKERVKIKVQEIKGVVEVIKGDAEKERLLKNAETFLTLNEIGKARDIYSQISNDYPEDVRGWFGLACIVKNEMYDLFSNIEENANAVSFVNLGYTSSYSGGAKAINILNCLSSLNYYYNKLRLLDNNYAKKITEYEMQFVKDYETRKLPFINWLSAFILGRYNIVQECSDVIKEWAKQIVTQYIRKFNVGEVTDLYWHVINPNEEINLYPDAIAFLKDAYNNAQHLNKLSPNKLSNFLRTMGIDRMPSGECVFWQHKTLLFSYGSGYDHSFNVYNTQIPITSTSVTEIVNEKSMEIESKCTEALHLCVKLNDVESALHEIIRKFACAGTRIKTASYDWETNFSYRITKINASMLEYNVSYLWNNKPQNETKRVTFNADTKFDEIIILLRKYSNKCSFCGGNFKGIFTKVCTTCGKTKNY